MYRIYNFAVLVIYSTYLINISALKRFRNSKRNVQYKNVYKSVNVLWMVKRRSVIACFTSCADDINCWSVAFNKNDGRCQAFNRDFTNQPVNGIAENGWTHYDVSPVTVCKTVTPNTQAKNCSEVQFQGHSCSGVYTIYPSVNIQKDVWCDLQTLEGRWTKHTYDVCNGLTIKYNRRLGSRRKDYQVFQQRKDGSVDFYRKWSDYEHGFGDPKTEYWIGNEALFQLTLSDGNELLILMQTWDGVWKYAHYTDFYIGPKNDNYRLHFSEYSGSAGNSLFIQVGYQFSTLDTDNDVFGGSCNPKYHKGGFWFKDCGYSDLNGYYYPYGIISGDSCHWRTFTES